MLSSAGHSHTTLLTVHPHQLKPSPLSSADNNLPLSRDLQHLNAVQAVNYTYHSPTSASVSAFYSTSNSTSTSASTSTSTSTSTTNIHGHSQSLSLPPHYSQHASHQLRRMPNLSEYHRRSGSLSIPNGNNNNGSNNTTANNHSNNIGGGSNASSPSAAMSSINAIAAGPAPGPVPAHGSGGSQRGGTFEGPRSPPSKCQSHCPHAILLES